jgi:hypothetical protein
MNDPHEDCNLMRLARSSGLELLRQAKAYAADSGRSPWDFGVELDALIRGGLSTTDLRWLIAKGFVEHADEKTRLIDRARRFRPMSALIFPPRTCLVLTDAGIDVLSLMIPRPDPSAGAEVGSCGDTAVLRQRRGTQRFDANTQNAAETPPEPQQRGAGHRPDVAKSLPSARGRQSRGPNWNPDMHELRFGRQLVKAFKRPATSQELILAAFEEEGWPEVLDDPLPMNQGNDSKRRLHYTVHHLNRGQRPFLIRFSVNGSGQRIYWRPARDRQISGARRARKRS